MSGHLPVLQPLELDVLKAAVKEAGIKCSMDTLMTFLDEQVGLTTGAPSHLRNHHTTFLDEQVGLTTGAPGHLRNHHTTCLVKIIPALERRHKSIKLMSWCCRHMAQTICISFLCNLYCCHYIAVSWI